MQERRVSVAGADRPLPLAVPMCSRRKTRLSRRAPTRSPKRSLDRFLMQIDVVDYPDLEAERRIVVETTGAREEQAAHVLDAAHACSRPRNWSGISRSEKRSSKAF